MPSVISGDGQMAPLFRVEIRRQAAGGFGACDAAWCDRGSRKRLAARSSASQHCRTGEQNSQFIGYFARARGTALRRSASIVAALIQNVTVASRVSSCDPESDIERMRPQVTAGTCWLMSRDATSYGRLQGATFLSR